MSYRSAAATNTVMVPAASADLHRYRLRRSAVGQILPPPSPPSLPGLHLSIVTGPVITGLALEPVQYPETALKAGGGVVTRFC